MTQLAAIPAELQRAEPVSASAHTASRACRAEVRHYRIGPVGVCVRSDLAGVEEAFRELYAAHEVDVPARAEFVVEAVARRSPRSLRRYYHILANGEELFVVRRPSAVLPHLEWALNILVARYLPGYLQIHASTMSRDGAGVIFPGRPQHGKTTLAAGLLACGWSYFSDEFALIDPDTRELHAYPKALCVKKGSWETLQRLGLPLDDRRSYVKGEKGRIAFINPLDVRPDVVAEPCPIRLVVFPEYEKDATPRLEPISRAQAAFELIRVSFNFARFRTPGFELLADLVKDAHCYRLRSGDLEATCRLVEDCVQRHTAKGGSA